MRQEYQEVHGRDKKYNEIFFTTTYPIDFAIMIGNECTRNTQQLYTIL